MVVKRNFVSSVCKRGEFEDVVQNGLSVTPAQMLELTNQGFPISARNVQMLNSVDPADSDFYVPLQYRRGVDLADLSEHSHEVRNKLKKAVEKYDKGEIQDIRKE